MNEYVYKREPYDVLTTSEEGIRTVRSNHARYVSGWMMPIRYIFCIDENDVIVEVPTDGRQNASWKNWHKHPKANGGDMRNHWIGQVLKGDSILPTWR